MTDDLERLEALAMAATPGPWRDVKSQAWVQRDKQGPHDETGSVCIAQCGDMQDADLVPFNADRWRADAAFIAAANPTTIISLIQRVREADAELASSRADRLSSHSIVRHHEKMVVEAHAAGRAEALEEAASEAWRVLNRVLFKEDPSQTTLEDRIASAIRALGEKAG